MLASCNYTVVQDRGLPYFVIGDLDSLRNVCRNVLITLGHTIHIDDDSNLIHYPWGYMGRINAALVRNCARGMGALTYQADQLGYTFRRTTHPEVVSVSTFYYYKPTIFTKNALAEKMDKFVKLTDQQLTAPNVRAMKYVLWERFVSQHPEYAWKYI